MTSLLRKIIIGGYFVFLGLGVVYVVFTVKNNNQITHLENIDGVVCAMDAKICPDGSAVVRISPSCEFAQCPKRINE